MELNVTYSLKLKMQAGEKIFTAMAGPGNDPKKTVKALKAFGYDAVIVDLEHTLLNDETVLSYILAGKETGLPIWLRPEENYANYRRYLDSGINGLLLGQVHTLEQAVYAVNQSYPPPSAIEAQQKGSRAIKPGVKLSEIHKTIEEVVRSAGYSGYTRSMFGHSIGLECEEQPFISASCDAVFEPNMVFCVEVSWYQPGWVGMNAEDMVLVTEDGCEELSTMPKELYVVKGKSN